MSPSLIYRPQAWAEIMTAAEWYEERRTGLGGEFLDVLFATIDMVEANPLHHPLIGSRVRRAVLKRFPYSVLYAVLGEQIVVVGCVHWRRHPRRWARRGNRRLR